MPSQGPERELAEPVGCQSRRRRAEVRLRIRHNQIPSLERPRFAALKRGTNLAALRNHARLVLDSIVEFDLPAELARCVNEHILLADA